MLDLSLVRTRLLDATGCPLRDIRLSGNVEAAMQETVPAPRAFVLDLGETFGRNATGSAQTSQMVQVEFGVLLALPDQGRHDQTSVLQAPRAFVRRALLGWSPDGLTAIEGLMGRLVAAGPVLWWLDSFTTQYIETGG